MSENSKIEWTDATWSPVRARVKPDAAQIAHDKGYPSLVQLAGKMAGHAGPHCEHASPGCDHCYSENNNGRCLPSNGTGLPFDRRSRDLVDMFVDQKILEQPLHWKRPRRVFVCSQTDLFAEFVTDEMIDRVFAVMALCPQHTFQVLTKRADRMEDYFTKEIPLSRRDEYVAAQAAHTGKIVWDARGSERHNYFGCGKIGDISNRRVWPGWPLPNVWLGVSVEDQQRADERIPHLLRTPAAVRFLSVEPMLGPVDIRLFIGLHAGNGEGEFREKNGWGYDDWSGGYTGPNTHRDSTYAPEPGIHWVICGGESGPGARPMEAAWAQSVRDQCIVAGVPFFFKQWGEWAPGRAEVVEGCINHTNGRYHYQFDPSQVGPLMRLGKKAAGRVLDGRTWDEMPEVAR